MNLSKYSILLLSLLICSFNLNGEDDPIAKLEAELYKVAPAKSDANAKKIIQTHIRARGGLANIEAIRSLEFKGALREGKADYDIRILRAAPDYYRKERSKTLLGRTNTEIEGYNGLTGWTYDPSRKNARPVILKGKELQVLAHQSNFYGPFINYEDQGLVFSYLGQKMWRGRNHYMVKMYQPNGRTKVFYFDAKTMMVTRISWEDIDMKNIIQFDTYITKYHKVNSVWFEQEFEMAIAKQVYGTLKYRSIKANPSIKEGAFNPPQFKQVWLRK